MKTISLVIREAVHLNRLKELLATYDFNILTAKQSLFESAFDIILRKPDLIIISYSIMINSVTFLKAVTKSTQAKLLVYYTGSNIPTDEELKGLDVKYLSNTFTEKELPSIIDGCLASDKV